VDLIKCPLVLKKGGKVVKSETLAGRATLYCGDCMTVLADMEAGSVDSVVTDPPYGLEFMGKKWDGADGFRRSLNQADVGRDKVFGRLSARGPEYRAGHLFQEWCKAWACEVLRVLKPGGHIVAFGGTRTYHRMVCAIEDAGFEVRDQIGWLYGQGFPKSHDISKAIDRAAGAERAIIGRGMAGLAKGESRDSGSHTVGYSDEYDITEPATLHAKQWQGWGTALKPAWEPICLARKPLIGTVAANVLEHGTGALNIDGCRVDTRDDLNGGAYSNGNKQAGDATSFVTGVNAGKFIQPMGRWPANIVHDGSQEVLDAFPDTGASKASAGRNGNDIGDVFSLRCDADQIRGHDDSGGSAARFFYSAKADDHDRIGSKHPTVKPVDLMQWLVRLITPPGGTVLDPFAGSGSTGEAAFREGMSSVLIEREPEHQEDIRRRMGLVMAGPDERSRETVKEKLKGKEIDAGPLFDLADDARGWR
jgi:DNA modification methylase